LVVTVIAVTGGFGTGKTTVAGMFREQGAKVLDVDSLVRELEQPGKKAWKKIVESFGQQFVLPDRSLNRGALARTVFSDENALQRLNKAVHPLITAETRKRVNRMKKASSRVLIVVDIPLLFEVGEEGFFDFVVVVTASESKVIQRLSGERGLSSNEIRQRAKAQFPLEEKARRAHFVIDNNNGLSKTRQQVFHVYQAVSGKTNNPF
jgi:dephospho-CoA kinase